MLNRISARRVPKRLNTSRHWRFMSTLCLCALVAACRTTRPGWTYTNKEPDNLYVYQVGHAECAPTGETARNIAFSNACEALAGDAIKKAGAASSAVSPGTLGLEGAEVSPKGIYVEKSDSGYEAWVQVAFPRAEAQRLVARLKTGVELNRRWNEARDFLAAGNWESARAATRNIETNFTDALGLAFSLPEVSSLAAEIDRSEFNALLNAGWNEARTLRDRGESTKAVPLLERLLAQYTPGLRPTFERAEATLMLADLWRDQKKDIRARRLYEELAGGETNSAWKALASQRLASCPPLPRMGPLNARWDGRNVGLMCIMRDRDETRLFTPLFDILAKDCIEAEMEPVNLAGQVTPDMLRACFESDNFGPIAAKAAATSTGVVLAVFYDINPALRNQTSDVGGVVMPVADARVIFVVLGAGSDRPLYRGQFKAVTEGKADARLAPYAASILISKYLVPSCPAINR